MTYCRAALALSLALSLALGTTAPATAQAPSLLVSGYTSGQVHAFDAAGDALAPLGAADGAQSMRYGPDGHLYVCAEEQDAVLRFDGQTGAPLGPFVWDDPLTPNDESGGLRTPTAAVFGPDGMLYVASFIDDAVLRYDGATGAYVDDFIPSGTGAINGPDAGMDFGPDGHLYIPSFNNHRILRYHGKTGAPLGAFAPVSQLVLSRPRCLRWRGDGLLYVTSWGNNRINRYDLDGQLVDVFATVTRPTGIAFGPDGHVYVASDSTDRVSRFDGESGAPLGVVVEGAANGVDGATYVEWFPNPDLRMHQPWPRVAGQDNVFEVSNATPGGLVWIGAGVATTSLPFGCPGNWLGVSAPVVVPVIADGSGRFETTLAMGAGSAGATLVLQAYDSTGACLSNLVASSFD